MIHPQMVCREVQGFRIDPDQLRDHCQYCFDRYGMTMQGPNYGGLSLQQKGKKGSLADSIVGSGEVVKKNEHGEYVLDWDRYNALHDVPDLYGISKKTILAQNNLLEYCLDFFQDLGLFPYRGRMVYLLAGTSLPYHIDTVEESWRAHIPVITNPDCYFEWNDDQVFEQIKMPADGRAWVVRTDVRHSFFNNGDTHRLHVVISLKRRPLDVMYDNVSPIFEE